MSRKKINSKLFGKAISEEKASYLRGIDSLENYNKLKDDYFISLWKNGINKEIADMVKKQYSSINRLFAMHILAEAIPITNKNIIPCCVIVEYGSIKVVIGFIYARVKSNKIYIEHFCYGPGFVSQDGEYRTNFINSNTIYRVEYEFPDIIDSIVGFVEKCITVRGYQIIFNIYPKDKSQKKFVSEIKKFVKSNNIIKYLLSFVWFFNIYSHINNIVPNHINSYYKRVFMQKAFLLADKKYYEHLVSVFSKERMNQLRVLTQNYLGVFSESTSSSKIKMGQKFIPLRELEKQIDIRFKPWKELLISKATSRAVINGISPAFAMCNHWFYIRNNTADIYDNPSQIEKIESSNIAKKVQEHLANATKYLRDFRHEKDIEKYICIDDLENKIHNPMEQIDETLIMSEYSICILSEYVGRTMYDCIKLCEISDLYKVYLGYCFQAKGYDYFEKYVFDLLFGLLTLNKKFGVIHGDFHTNNCTMHPLFYKHQVDINDLKTPTVLYYLEDNTGYMLKSTSYHGCIIDFSRAVVLPEFFPVLEDKYITEVITKDEKKFMSIQISKMNKTLRSNFSSYDRDDADLTALGISYFDVYFKLFSAFDIYKVCQGLKSQLSTSKNDTKKQLALLDRIIPLAEKYLTQDLRQVLNNKANVPKYNEMPYPNETILRKVFKNREINDKTLSKRDIVDIYSLKNDLKYSFDKKLPKVLQMKPPHT